MDAHGLADQGSSATVGSGRARSSQTRKRTLMQVHSRSPPIREEIIELESPAVALSTPW